MGNKQRHYFSLDSSNCMGKERIMKTLDEVITAIGLCWADHCFDCPYHEKKHEESCIRKRDTDALHYLKAFRDAKDTLEREKDRYAEAVRNCERAENKYKRMQEYDEVSRRWKESYRQSQMPWNQGYCEMGE